jgi:hypothetical protein
VRLGEYDVDVPRALLVVFALVVISVLVYGGATSVSAFGAFNPSWEGTSDLRGLAGDAGADTEVATNATAYDDYGNGTVAVVVAPEEPYDPADVRRIEAFLDRGGTLLIADRDGTANDLLAGLDADARLDGAVVRDERNNYRHPALPEATKVTEHSLTRGVDVFTLNYGTTVEPGAATVLVATSEFAYPDRDGNGQVGDDEMLASAPVATTEAVGDGRVIVVGDGSAFINVMADRPGNRAFATNAFDGSETVLIDTSHGGDVPPVIAALLAVRNSPPLQGLLFGVVLVAVFAWQRRLYPQPSEPSVGGSADPDAVAASAAGRYPRMDRGRLARLMKGINSFSSQADDDE